MGDLALGLIALGHEGAFDTRWGGEIDTALRACAADLSYQLGYSGSRALKAEARLNARNMAFTARVIRVCPAFPFPRFQGSLDVVLPFVPAPPWRARQYRRFRTARRWARWALVLLRSSPCIGAPRDGSRGMGT